jgi:transposase InsO family protein
VVQENLTEFNVDLSSPKDFFCQVCVEGKMHVAPFPQRSDYVASAVGDLVVTDVWGHAQVESLQRNKYYASFVDVYSRMSVIYFVTSTKQVRECYKLFEALVKTQTGRTIRRLRSDNGKEYINAELREYAASQGTIMEQTSPHSSSQNGIAERLNRTLADLSRAGMARHDLPKYLWQESIAHANFVRNRLPTRATGKTPFEMFYGRKAPLRYMEEFGAEI